MVGSGQGRAEGGMAVSMGDFQFCPDTTEVHVFDGRTSRALVSDTHVLRHNRVGECQRGNFFPWAGKSN